MHATGLASPASASTSDPGEPHTGRLPTRCVAVAKPLACPLSFGAPHSGRSRRDFTARQSGGPRQCLPASHLRLTSYPADRLHDKHPPPPASEPSRQPAAEGSGGVNFGRRSPGSGGQNCTPKHSAASAYIAHGEHGRMHQGYPTWRAQATGAPFFTPLVTVRPCAKPCGRIPPLPDPGREGSGALQYPRRRCPASGRQAVFAASLARSDRINNGYCVPARKVALSIRDGHQP